MGRKSAELEVGLRWRRDDEKFDLSIHYDDPGDASDFRELGADPLSIDVDSLFVQRGNLDGYASLLTDQVLRPDSDVLKMYQQARAVADNGQLPLHLRLLLDPKAPPKYHALR